MNEPDLKETVYIARLKAVTDIITAHLAITKVKTSELSELVTNIYTAICGTDRIHADKYLSGSQALSKGSFQSPEGKPGSSDALLTRISKELASQKKSFSDQQTKLPEKPTPAVPVRESVFPDYIICLEDGKKLKTLKKHLTSAYGMSLNDYKKKWGLPAEYPTVAPNYSAKRKEVARSIGLGRINRPEITHKTGNITHNESTDIGSKDNKDPIQHTANLLKKMASQ